MATVPATQFVELLQDSQLYRGHPHRSTERPRVRRRCRRCDREVRRVVQKHSRGEEYSAGGQVVAWHPVECETIQGSMYGIIMKCGQPLKWQEISPVNRVRNVTVEDASLFDVREDDFTSLLKLLQTSYVGIPRCSTALCRCARSINPERTQLSLWYEMETGPEVLALILP